MEEQENGLFYRIKTKIKNADIKSIIKVLTLIFGLGLIILMTIAHVILDPSKMDFNTWLSKTILMVAISIFGIVMGELIGADKQMSAPNGLYQQTLKEYNIVEEKIRSITIYFNDFLIWFKEKETKAKIINYLIDNGITDAKQVIDNVKLEDLEELSKHPIKYDNDVIVRQKTLDQIKIIRNVLEGKIYIKAQPSSYYLSAYDNDTSSSQLEVGKYLNNKIKLNKTFGRVFKIVSSVFISAVWAMISVQEFMNAEDVSAWVDLVLRITTLFTCLFSGWLTAVIDVKLKAQIIKNKINVLDIFNNAYASKEFIPLNYENLALAEYEKYIEDTKQNDVIEDETQKGDIENEQINQ